MTMVVDTMTGFVSSIRSKLYDTDMHGVFCVLNRHCLSDREKKRIFCQCLCWYLSTLFDPNIPADNWSVVLRILGSVLHDDDNEIKILNDLSRMFWDQVSQVRCPLGVPCTVCASL